MIKRKTELIVTVTRLRINDITIEVCHGEIPDSFRQIWFGILIEFELPDTKMNREERFVHSEEFQKWLDLYRHSEGSYINELLEKSKCD